MFKRKTASKLLGVLSAMAIGMAAQAGQYPQKPINVVVPFPPGGPVDTLARILSKSMSASLGQQIIIENKPGAGGSIGAYQVARAAKDGYTLLMTASSFAMDPAIRSNLPFDPRKGMHGVVNVASGPVVLLVKQPLPVESLPQFLQLLKKEPGNVTYASTGIVTSAVVRGKDMSCVFNGARGAFLRLGKQHVSVESLQQFRQRLKKGPGRLSYASTGIATVNHFAGELLKDAAQVDALRVPYDGAAPAAQAIVAGEVDFFFNNVLSSVPLVAAGRVKALAVTSAQRWPAFPDVPTLKESGVPVEISSW